jgi:hypothetical protein
MRCLQLATIQQLVTSEHLPIVSLSHGMSLLRVTPPLIGADPHIHTHDVHADAVLQEFLPFLPEDEAGGADPAAEEVVQFLARDLQALLAAPDADFWAAVTGNASLAACLDSYLQNSRWAG